MARAGHRHLEAGPGAQAALHRGQEVGQLILPQHYTLELSTNLCEVSLAAKISTQVSPSVPPADGTPEMSLSQILVGLLTYSIKCIHLLLNGCRKTKYIMQKAI